VPDLARFGTPLSTRVPVEVGDGLHRYVIGKVYRNGLSSFYCDGVVVHDAASAWARAWLSVLVQVVAQGLGAGGMAQFGHRLTFDLPDAFSGDSVDVADFIERAWSAVDEPESQPDNVGLSHG
jgi:hypothetical protein